MVLKAEFYVGGTDHNKWHTRVIEVYDFHIETLTDEARGESTGKHELIYHTNNGHSGTLRMGISVEGEDHLYVMESGKTIDHMVFRG